MTAASPDARAAEWAVRLPAAGAAAAAALRLRPGIRAGSDGESVWLRGPNLTDDLERELRKLPGAVRFAVSRDGRLTAAGARVPKGRLPDVPWAALSQGVVPAPQPAALAGRCGPAVSVRLVRSGVERPAALLLTTAREWADYASGAPAVRLKPLKFAARADGRVLVWGTPLPPVGGRPYAETEGIAAPCGFAWEPAVDAAVLRELLGLGPGDVALLDADGGYEPVEAGAFAAATRAAARETAGGLG